MELIAFPVHALLIVEERLREQEAEGVRMPERIPLDELALRVLIAAETGEVPLSAEPWQSSQQLARQREAGNGQD